MFYLFLIVQRGCLNHATQLSHPQANVQPGSPAMQLMPTCQCLLLLMPRTMTMASNVEWHEDARKVHRTTVSNMECHKNTRTMMVVKVPLHSVVSSESVVAIVPEHLVKVFFFFVSCVLVDRYINIMLDIVMHSPPKETIPVHGSSHSMGGSSCGHVIGNTFNIADAREVWSEFNYPDGEPTKGKIYLYISDLNPAVIDIFQSSFVVNVFDTAKCQTVQDVMKQGSHDYSLICSKFFYLYFFN